MTRHMTATRPLFVKIFLWFWLVMALTGTVLFVIAVTGDRARTNEARQQRDDERRGQMGRMLAFYGETAVKLVATGGTESLDAYSDQLARTAGIRPFFFLDPGDIASGAAPPDVRELAGRARDSGTIEYTTRRDEFVLAQPVRDASGRHYVVVGKTRLDPEGRMAPAAQDRAGGGGTGGMLDRYSMNLGRYLVILFVIGSAACYILTWHLTSPLRHLRSVAQRLAGGELSARAGRELSRRGDEIADLGRDIDRMAERTEGLIHAQQRLLRDISHELRSPLARLNVALELARQSAGAGAAGSLDRIERESVRLNELIGQLLVLARIDGDDGRFHREPVDLARLLADVARDADFEARGSHRRVETQINGHAIVDGNPELLRQAFENVIRNAVRYTAEDTAVMLSLETAGDTGAAVITVRDHGSGVPEDELSNIFRPFYRVSDSRERESGGTGIGLAITGRAIGLHGGNVGASNAPGGGLVITMMLPLASPAQTARGATAIA